MKRAKATPASQNAGAETDRASARGYTTINVDEVICPHIRFRGTVSPFSASRELSESCDACGITVTYTINARA